ncbi:MAG: Sensor protein ZraS [Phycisphaerae bacterium]|nr:Sensor protein ZraS [Phycisphaerae bacterium]
MSTMPLMLSQRERELAAIISAYNEVTEQLKHSHESLQEEVRKLREELDSKRQELARQERLAALGQMATGVAHEIRNPLGGIQLYVSLLEKDLIALPQSQRLVRKVSAGVDALERVVSDILDFAGRQEPQKSAVALQLLVSNAMDMAKPRAESQQVQMLLETSVLNYEVRVDAQQMERAILNILLNAVEAAGTGGLVRIEAEQTEANTIALSISDSGPGVPPEIMERIFNPFFTTKDRGTGMGLSIVHRVMDDHGGCVRVSNRAEGGACFTLEMAAVQTEPELEE